MKLKGHFSARYQPVRDAYLSLFNKGYDRNSQLCVYVKGEEVLNLSGGEMEKESNTIIFSCSKTISSILMAIM